MSTVSSKRSRDSTIGMLLGVALNAGAILIAARSLGATGRGEMVILTLVPTFGNVLLGLGMTAANVHGVASGRLTRGVAAGNSLLWALAVPFFVAAIVRVSGFHEVVAGWVSVEADLLLLALVLTAAVLGYQQLCGVVQGTGDFAAYRDCRVVQGLGMFALIGATAVSGSSSVENMFFAWSAAYGIGALYALGRSSPVRGLRVRIGSLFASLRYGVKAMWTQIWDIMNVRADQVVVATLADARVLGIYSVAVAISELLFHIPNALALVVFSESATGSNAGRTRGLGVFAGRVLAAAFAAALLLAGFTWLALPLVVGSEFSSAALGVLILGPGVAILSSARILGAHEMGDGRPHVPGFGAAVSVVVTIVVDIVLVPRLGLSGAALGASLGYACAALTVMGLFGRNNRVDVSPLIQDGVRDMVRFVVRRHKAERHA